jgi:hypothetical protein
MGCALPEAGVRALISHTRVRAICLSLPLCAAHPVGDRAAISTQHRGAYFRRELDTRFLTRASGTRKLSALSG